MAPSLTIGQVAKASGVAAKTIRYYEQVGLLPAARRTASGYRLYDEPGVERLRFVRRARSLGLPLHQLKLLAGPLDGGARHSLRPRLRGLVRAQLDAVTNRITELQGLRRQLEQILERMLTSGPGPDGGGCRCLGSEPGTPGSIGGSRTSQ